MVDQAVRSVPLTRGMFALVDASDWDIVSPFRWRIIADRNNRLFYAVTGQNRDMVRMHRLLLNAPSGVMVDHCDGDGLNNRRSNIRLATTVENGRNLRPQVGRASKFKGVTRCPSGRWRARIGAGRQIVHLAVFDTEEEAAKCYDEAALRLFGEFARLNFPEVPA